MSDSTYTQKAWSLADLFPAPDSPELEAAIGRLKQMSADFAAQRDAFRSEISVETFLGLVKQFEEINELGSRVGSYASLLFSENTQNQAALGLMARTEQLGAELGNQTLFFSLWWKDLDEANAERLMSASGDYRYWLEEMRHFKPYTLSEAEEKIINIKDVTGASALRTIYSSITNRYTFRLNVDGQERDLTRGELMVFARHHDPDLRARAYQKLYEVYGNDAPILGQIYQALVRDWRNENLDLRGHKTPMGVRNLINDIPDEVVNTLLDVAQKNAGLFQRFFQLKARRIGMDKLRRYDIYAPVAKADKEYPFEKAAAMVFESFRSFDPKLETLARRVFETGHLDSEVRKGKRGGAFCATPTPRLTPWVLVNYQSRPDDAATLAHELGHAIHSQLADHHSAFTQHACLPLAETASTFGEMMLVDKMLAEESDPAVRRDILFRQVDDSYATIQRQVFFALFERQAHEMIQAGASVDELAAAYLENLKLQFGDAVEVNEEFKWEWVSIPHIFDVPFYVYAYAFGQLLVLALYQQYQREGEAFKPRYFKILSTGGAQAPVELLAEAGIDVRQAAFWQGGFDVIAGLVEQLENL